MDFTIEWYFNQFLIILTQRMGLDDSDALSPYELNEYIKQYPEIFALLKKFFKEYQAWYDYHKALESEKIEFDAIHLTNLSSTFKQTRELLLQKADEARGA